MCFYLFCPIFAPLQPQKSSLQPFFIYVVCARTLYIGKTHKSVLFAVCSRFPFYMYVCTIFRFWYVYSRFIFRFRFHSLFVSRNLCVKHYASFCIFTQSIMVNRKLFWEFRAFLAPLQKRSIFLLFVPLLFILFWINYRKRKQKRKSRFLWCFCPKTPVFVANKTLIFSDL